MDHDLVGQSYDQWQFIHDCWTVLHSIGGERKQVGFFSVPEYIDDKIKICRNLYDDGCDITYWKDNEWVIEKINELSYVQVPPYVKDHILRLCVEYDDWTIDSGVSPTCMIQSSQYRRDVARSMLYKIPLPV